MEKAIDLRREPIQDLRSDELSHGPIGRRRRESETDRRRAAALGAPKQRQASGPSLRSLEQPTNPFGQRFHPLELEKFCHLGGVEDEVGHTDLEHLATHSSSAAGKPHLPATRDDQLNMIRQEIEEQTHRVTAFP